MTSSEAVRNKKRVPILFLDLDGTVRKGFDELEAEVSCLKAELVAKSLT